MRPASERSLPEMQEVRAQSLLLAAPGLGAVSLGRLLQRFGSSRAALAATDEQLAAAGLNNRMLDGLRSARRAANGREGLREALARGARMVSLLDEAYPNLLKSIYDPPALYWTEGLPIRLDAPRVAVVGTRRPSAAGKSAAYSIAYDLAARGVTIVSGLAFGIDATAHRAALDAGGLTIAVLGSGLDRIYPRTHVRLAERIRASGCLVSEFPLNQSAHPGHFPRRNRIISGLCEATVVVEAYEKGGALITARLALDQNREVFAVPGPIGNEASRGTNGLIQRGEAELLTGPADVAARLGLGESHGCASVVDDADRPLLDAVSIEPVHIDDLAEKLDRSVTTLLTDLLQLECTGHVRQLPGKYFVRHPGGG